MLRPDLDTLLPERGAVDLAPLVHALGGPTVVPVPADRWPLRHVANGGEPFVLPADATVLVAQARVSAALVRAKLGLPVADPRLSTRLGALCVTPDGRGRWFLWDGHHALVARLLAGEPLEAWRHAAVSPMDPRGVLLAVPRLRMPRGG